MSYDKVVAGMEIMLELLGKVELNFFTYYLCLDSDLIELNFSDASGFLEILGTRIGVKVELNPDAYVLIYVGDDTVKALGVNFYVSRNYVEHSFYYEYCCATEEWHISILNFGCWVETNTSRFVDEFDYMLCYFRNFVIRKRNELNVEICQVTKDKLDALRKNELV